MRRIENTVQSLDPCCVNLSNSKLEFVDNNLYNVTKIPCDISLKIGIKILFLSKKLYIMNTNKVQQYL